MNLSEIRAKYPQYDSISDDVLVQKLHDKYYPDMDIAEFSNRVGYTPKQQEQFTPEQIESFRQQALEMNKNSGIDGWSVAKEGLKGAGKGLIGGTERILGGATFGLTDWIGDKLGTGVKERRKELEDLSGVIKGLDTGLEIISGIPTGGGLYKGIGSGLKALPKVGKALWYLTPTVTGAVSGGLYSGFENDSLDSAGQGALIGGALGGALDLVGRGVSKAFSAAQKVKGTPRGFENAAGTKTGSRVLNRAVKESDNVAEEVYRKAPEAMENLNRQAIDKLDDAVRGVDVKGQMAGAKKAYGDFIDTNKANQVIEGKFTPEEYQKNLQKWFKGSKVVDETGKPLKVYHATNADFDSFDKAYIKRGFYGDGFYFSNDKESVAHYGPKIKEVYLNIKKPIEGIKSSELRKNLQKYKDLGYDGTIHRYNDGTITYSAFEPNQIKSVQNTGAFTNTANLSDKGVKPLAKVSDLGITGLTDNQKGWLNQAWSAGKRNTLEKAGSLGHLDEMSKELNKMVQGSRLANPNGVGTIATPETVALQGLKDKVDDVIEKAGLQNIKAQYRQAKALEDSFNRGLKFKPTDVKTRSLTFASPDEKNAFAQGLVEQIKMNSETKNIAGKARDLRGALREVLGEKADNVFNDIDKLDRSYKNIGKIFSNAERKLTVPEPINGNLGLRREFLESLGSMIGGTADFARKWATAKSAERAAQYLLNPNMKIGTSLYEAVRPYLPTLGGLGIGNLIRKGE